MLIVSIDMLQPEDSDDEAGTFEKQNTQEQIFSSSTIVDHCRQEN